MKYLLWKGLTTKPLTNPKEMARATIKKISIKTGAPTAPTNVVLNPPNLPVVIPLVKNPAISILKMFFINPPRG